MKELFERITKEKQTRILMAATNEFAQNGFEHANINEIAKAAGVSIGSMYKYFSSKQDLFLTTVNHCAGVLRTTLESVMQIKDDWQSKIGKIIRIIQRHSRENKVIIQLYNEMTTQRNSGIVMESVHKVESLSAELYADLIRQAKQERSIRSDCDDKMFAFLMDNLFMMLQYSYACDYYRERFKVYVNYDILEKDDYVAKQMLNFIKGALSAGKES